MDPITMMILMGIAGAAQGGLGAAQAGQQENARRDAARAQRVRLQNLINNLRNINYADVDMAQSAAYTRAANSATANAAARGVSGGVRNASQDRVLAGAIADLARFKTQDQMAREQAIAQILSNDAYTVPNDAVNVGLQMLMGGLAGGAGGAMQGAGAVMGNPELMALMGQGAAQLFGAQAPFNEQAGQQSLDLTARASRGDGGLSRVPPGYPSYINNGSAPSGWFDRPGSPMRFTPGSGAGLYNGVMGNMLATLPGNTSIQKG